MVAACKAGGASMLVGRHVFLCDLHQVRLRRQEKSHTVKIMQNDKSEQVECFGLTSPESITDNSRIVLIDFILAK